MLSDGNEDREAFVSVTPYAGLHRASYVCVQRTRRWVREGFYRFTPERLL